MTSPEICDVMQPDRLLMLSHCEEKELMARILDTASMLAYTVGCRPIQILEEILSIARENPNGDWGFLDDGWDPYRAAIEHLLSDGSEG